MTFVLLVMVCLLSVGMFCALDMLSFAIGRTGWRRLLSTFLIFYAQIISTEFLLGLTHVLYNYSLALLNITITLAIFVVLRKRYGTKLFSEYTEHIKAIPGTIKNCARGNLLLAILCTLAGAFLVWVLFIGLIFPPVDWDGNAYHLTYAADLVQDHNIYDIPSDMSWLIGYPKGGEMIQAWTLLLAHNDTLVDLTQVPFAILAIVSLYAIARNLRINKRTAAFVALLFLFTPIVLNQLTTGYVDVILCATFFASLALILQRTYSRLDLLLIGVTFSLLIAIKSSGLYFIIALLPILVWNLHRVYGMQIKKYLSPATFIISPMIFGIYWYAKDLILYGSPIYPFGFKIAGKTIFRGLDYSKWSSGSFAGLPSGAAARVWYSWTEQNINHSQFIYNYDSNYIGLGIIWFVVLIPAFLLSVYLAIKKRRYYMLAAFILLLGLLVIYPTNFSPRYTMFILSVGIIGLGFVLDNLHTATTVVIKTFIIALGALTIILTSSLYSYPPHAVHTEIADILSHKGEHGDGTVFATTIGGAYEFMHKTVRPGQVIVYTSGYFIYPLWNKNLSNKVTYSNAATEQSWIKDVKRDNATFIFATTNTKGSKQSVWAKDAFQHVIYKDAVYEIYEVN